MYATHWRFHGLALAAATLVGCSDKPATTEPEAPQAPRGTLSNGPVAFLSAGDPTAIPIGPPTAIELLGRAPASRRTLTFPLPVAPVDPAPFAQAAAEWVASEKARGVGSPDDGVAQAVQSIEALLAARTPEEVRAALGPSECS
jgi:hypothetical protein